MKDETEEEEDKEETGETKRQRLFAKWQKVIEEDAEQMATTELKQRPLSRAYLSLCP